MTADARSTARVDAPPPPSASTKPRREDDDALGKAYDSALMRRLWTYLAPHRRLVWISTLLLPPLTFLHLFQPYVLKEAIDREVVAPGGSFGGLAFWGALYLIALVFESVLRYQQLFAMQVLGQRAMHDLRKAAFRHLQTLSSAFFHRTPMGRLLTRLTGDVDALSEMFASGVVSIVGDFITLALILLLLFVLSWRLALLTLFVAPFVVLLAWGFRIVAREAFRRIRAQVARMNAFLAEHVMGIREVQVFVREDRSTRDFAVVNDEHRAANFRSIVADSVLFALVELLASIAIAALLWRGAAGITDGALTFGTLVAFLEYVQKFFIPIRDLSAKFTVMQSGMAAAERVFSLLDTKPEIVAPQAPAPGLDPKKGLAFENVSFSYQAAGEPVLRDLSFHVPAGETVALVGATGAGKTTIASLLLRLYDVSDGAVRAFGQDVRSLDPRELRRRFAVVHQDVFLFAGDVLSNITLGDPEITKERAERAADAVGLTPILARHAEGIHAPVSERGANFSTGEKQLISFARALAREPDVLILDEATASIDAESEARIQAATSRLLEGRTAVVIAHRLTTIERAHRILVLHHGRLVESGTHDELMQKQGRYARLYALQFAEEA
jgi:ATP-binding cassette subfamily B protein